MTLRKAHTFEIGQFSQGWSLLSCSDISNGGMSQVVPDLGLHGTWPDGLQFRSERRRAESEEARQ